jgi:hypothetical protein
MVSRLLTELPELEMPDHYSDTYANDIYSLLCSKLIEPNLQLVPDDWYCRDQISINTQRGKMYLFFTNSYSFILVSYYSERGFLYCYDCRRRYKSCSHIAINIPSKKQEEITGIKMVPDNQEYRGPSNRKQLTRISKLRYPFHIASDVELCKEIQYRQSEGLKQWARRYNTHEFPRRPVFCCSLPATKIRAFNQSKKNYLFSTVGKVLLMEVFYIMWQFMIINAWCAANCTLMMDEQMVS